jgi:predicted nucleic acid-binding protein
LSTVVDASVLVAALVDAGPDGQWAEEVVASDMLLAPELAWVETANVLRRLEHAGKLTPSDAQAAYRDLMRVRLEVFSFGPFAERVWQLRHNVSCYDAWYVAVAEALNLPLATLDRRLSAAQGPTCAFLLPPQPESGRRSR